MMNPLLGMGLVLSIFGVLLTGLHAYRGRRSPDPEVLRKLLHVGMGVATLAFPWIFRRVWPIFLLALLFVLGLTALRIVGPLQPVMGSIIGGVNRKSLGEIFFPVAVALLFLLSGGDPLTFCIPMLILTFADAAAALIGRRYAVLLVPIANGTKSIEGCAAFFMVAFLSAYIPLWLFTNMGPAETLLIAATLALQVMLLEAVASGGLDNLFIPLGAFFLLKSFLRLDMTLLIAHSGIAVLLVTWFLVFSRPPTTNVGNLDQPHCGFGEPQWRDMGGSKR